MPKINVNIEFDSIEEASNFFGLRASTASPNTGLQQSQSQQTPAPSAVSSLVGSAAPTPAAGSALPLASSATTPAVAPSTSLATAPASTAPGSTGDVPPSILAARQAMSAYMGKFPSGQGAVKAKEILKAHGLEKIAGATEAQCSTLVTAFQTAA